MSSSDAELLRAVACRRDEGAFEVLLRRHGPMVWSVCTRVLCHTQDAEDAFQAAFLVLVRKAATIRKRESIASWLYGVAYRTARKAQATKARRRHYEGRAACRPRPAGAREFPELDRELNALPEKYRLPVVLCELQGRTCKEVADLLKIPEGTLSSRLATARKTLAKRLGQPGSFLLIEAATRSSLPAPLIISTVKVAALVMAGGEAVGVVSTNALVLSQGVLRAMLMMKLKSVAVAVVVMGTLGIGVGRYAHLAMAGGSVAGSDEPQAAGSRPGPSAETAVVRFDELVRTSQNLDKKPDQKEQGLDDPLARLKRAEANEAATLKQKEAYLATMQAEVDRSKALLLAVVDQRRKLELVEARNRQNALDATSTWFLDIAIRFKYRIPVELGRTESNEGCRIEIKKILGTRPKIEVGGQYMVHGKVTMPSRKRGKLYFYVTSNGTWGQSGETTFDLQSTTVEKDKGEFTLVHGMGGPGEFHLILYSDDGGKEVWLANQYFK